VEIFANQGVLEETPENTFAALRRIVELGIDGVLVDVRKTKDDQLILMRDETIDRTTDGKGRVDQLLYAEIKQYDSGSWRRAEFGGERVPLLSDVLKFCKINNLKLILNIRQVYLEKQVLELVRANDMVSEVYFWGAMRNIGAEDIELQGRELVFISSEEISEEKVSQIHEEKKYAFSIMLDNDNRKALKEQIRMGVDVILVDYPHVVMDILNLEDRVVSGKRHKKREIERTEQDTNNAPEYIRKNVDALVKTIEEDDCDKARTAALSLSVLPGKYTESPLLGLLNNKSPRVRQNAVWALGFCDGKRVGEHVQPLLKDKNDDVCREAALALRRLRAVQAVPGLIEALGAVKTDVHVKYDIARTLGEFHDQRAVFALVSAIKKEKKWLVKDACIEALGHIGGNKAVNILADVLTADAGEDASWSRTKAAWALAEIGTGAVPVLTKALGDNEETTRRRAEWALIKIGKPAVNALTSSLRETNPLTRERSAQTLGWIGYEGAVTSLIWALKDNESSVVCSAAWALGRIGSPKAIAPLRELINSKDEDIRENVVEAIGRIATKKEKVTYNKEIPQRP
jgi:HEAT repeat protein/glycerophosphoryl diester phosphodiesterase